MAAFDHFDVAAWCSDDQKGNKAAIAVTKPKELNCWTKTSITYEGGQQYRFGDRSGLAVFQAPPQLPLDLNEGYPASFIRKPDDAASARVGTIAEAAARGVANGGSNGGVAWARVSVVTFRNNMNKLLLTPLNARDAWAIDGCVVDGTLFLDIVATPERSWPDKDRMTYYGYKFEAVCTAGAALNGPVDATSEFGVVVSYKLGRHRVVMGAEIDAEMPAAPAQRAEGSNGQQQQQGSGGQQQQQQQQQGKGQQQQQPPAYVELKCYKRPAHARATNGIYRDKHPRWWVQSFLAGVGTLALGERDEAGRLLRVHTAPVASLPGASARAGQPWDADALLRFGDDALAWMAAAAAAAAAAGGSGDGSGDGSSSATVRFEYDPTKRAVSARVVDAKGGMAAGLRALLERCRRRPPEQQQDQENKQDGAAKRPKHED